MRVRILVASQSDARFFDLDHWEDMPRASGELTDSKAHLHNRDFNSDRPGRVFDHASSWPNGRREETPRRHEAAVFATRIADELERARRAEEFERLIVMAGPAFLGLLRHAFPEALRHTVLAEVPKDLVHQGASVVREHIPAGLPL
jgi:protein required for attachment to host cells